MPVTTKPPSANTARTTDFLRLSRASIDDSITQNLNALATPSKHGFDPSSTSRRAADPRALSRQQLDPEACRDFRDRVLFPSWQARTDALNYCSGVAASPDPDDPEAALREAERMRDRERVVDERLDPYSGRFFPSEPRTERLAAVIRLETGVENIVRHRTWEVVRDRCGGSEAEWEGAIAAWRKEEGRGRL